MTDSGPQQPNQPPDDQLESAFLLPRDFEFGPVSSVPRAAGLGPHAEVLEEAPAPAPPLGPLKDFTGTFEGTGFNTIFRPQNPATPTHLLNRVPGPFSDNILELNLTSEILSFSGAENLKNVPNRGMVQGDISFAGVSYLQAINDITGLDPTNPAPGIHFEPGLWMFVSATTDPLVGPTLMRMASIPHGTTVLAQGFSSTEDGPPNIPPVSITPMINQSRAPHRFDSQTATNDATARIPQDLSSFIKAGTITQDLLDDPNTLLRQHIASQKIISTTTISITTDPAGPLFGGGAANMAFLLGNPAALTSPAPAGPNAQTLGMQATFWIETVEHESVRSTQIQYSQQVFLNFNGLTWPHVSLATLKPKTTMR
jgi:hypothetical protein